MHTETFLMGSLHGRQLFNLLLTDGACLSVGRQAGVGTAAP